MTVLKRYRLLNVAKVRSEDRAGSSLDLRCDTTEITAEIRGVTLVCYRMCDPSEPEMPHPMLVGRLFIPGPPTVLKPTDLDDESRWVVQTPVGTVSIAPFESQHIFSDPTIDGLHPHQKQPVRLARLHEMRRSVLFSLLANRRYLHATGPDLDAAILAHQTTIGVMEREIERLDQQIAKCHD